MGQIKKKHKGEKGSDFFAGDIISGGPLWHHTPLSGVSQTGEAWIFGSDLQMKEPRSLHSAVSYSKFSVRPTLPRAFSSLNFPQRRGGGNTWPISAMCSAASKSSWSHTPRCGRVVLLSLLTLAPPCLFFYCLCEAFIMTINFIKYYCFDCLIVKKNNLFFLHCSNCK